MPRTASAGGALSGALRIGFDHHEAHEVSSCPQGLLSFYADTVRETLGLDRGNLLFGIAFGYAGRAAPVNRFSVGRAPLAETTRFHA